MRNNAIALGTFDGLHLGHQAVLLSTKEQKGIPSALLFTEHPQQVVCGAAPPMLLSDARREQLLTAWGISPLYISFREICDLTPEAFFYEILLKRFHASALSCGADYTFGKGKKGNIAVLKTLCEAENIPLHVEKIVCKAEKPISSTWIRTAIENGEMEEACSMLGRPFCVDFPVIHGEALGRTLGCPTINQKFPKAFVQPKNGVYITRVTIGGKSYAGVTNFGRKPTVGSKEVLAETYILQFSETVYGERPLVEFFRYLRPEQKFECLKALSAAIQNDGRQAEEYFKNTCKNEVNIVK